MTTIRDKVYYVRFFNRKHIKSDERMLFASDIEDAKKRIFAAITELPKFHSYEISEYYGDNNPIKMELTE